MSPAPLSSTRAATFLPAPLNRYRASHLVSLSVNTQPSNTIALASSLRLGLKVTFLPCSSRLSSDWHTECRFPIRRHSQCWYGLVSIIHLIPFNIPHFVVQHIDLVEVRQQCVIHQTALCINKRQALAALHSVCPHVATGQRQHAVYLFIARLGRAQFMALQMVVQGFNHKRAMGGHNKLCVRECSQQIP